MSKIYFKPYGEESLKIFDSIDDIIFLVNDKKHTIEDVCLSRRFKDDKLGWSNCYWVYINERIPFGIISI